MGTLLATREPSRSMLAVDVMHIFTAAEVHMPEVEWHLYSCNDHRNCEQLH